MAAVMEAMAVLAGTTGVLITEDQKVVVEEAARAVEALVAVVVEE